MENLIAWFVSSTEIGVLICTAGRSGRETNKCEEIIVSETRVFTRIVNLSD